MLDTLMFDTLAREFRCTVRQLRARPTFTLTVLLTLAIGVGSATLLFTIVEGVLLEPLPLRQPDRLVVLRSVPAAAGGLPTRVSEADLADWRHRQTSFSAIVGAHNRALTWSNGDDAEKLSAVVATADFFEALDTRTVVGRLLGEEDSDRDRVLLSHRFWHRHLGADEAVVGRRLLLDGKERQVVGVLPADFALPRKDVDIYLIRRLVPELRRGQRSFYTFGRLADDVTLEQARSELEGIAKDLAEAHEEDRGWGVAVEPLVEHAVGAVRAPLWLLFGGVGLLLLVMAANMSGLLLGRASERARELAVRRALGASPWRLRLGLLLEGLFLAVLGGGIGSLLARLVLPWVLTKVPGTLPRASEIELGGGGLIFAGSVILCFGVLFGVVPGLRAGRPLRMALLRSGTRVRSPGRSTSTLVWVEIALASMLLMMAGLLARSFSSLSAVDPGFSTESVAVVRVFARPGSFRGPEKSEYFSQIESALVTVPGVESVGGGSKIPYSHIGPDLDSPLLEVGGDPSNTAAEPMVSVRAVTPSFLSTLRAPLLSGRELSELDRYGGEAVVLVNRTLAEGLWPDQDVIGQTLRVRHGDWQERRVVGVVDDFLQDGPTAEPVPEVFVPHTQHDFYAGLAYVVRTRQPPEIMLPELRKAVLRFDPGQPPHSVTTMETLQKGLTSRQRFMASVASSFAVFALVLAGIGIYGVAASMVLERHQEIGIRMALGAEKKHIFSLIQGRTVLLLLTGIAAGMLSFQLAAWVVGKRLGGISGDVLFGVTAEDPLTHAGVAFVLFIVAGLASWVPTRAAVEVDPAECFRRE